MSARPDSSVAEKLTAMVRREVPSASLHEVEGDDGYWCLSWRLNDRAERELFLEIPERSVAPDVLRVGVYFEDAPAATGTAKARTAALEVLTARRNALEKLGAVCTFTPGSSTRDDFAFTWQTPDLDRWLTASCANRDLVWRWDLRAGAPAPDHLTSVVEELAPVWRVWNSL